MRSADEGDTFDYVIVGGGSAGCLLANRLSEGGQDTVCVLEAGPADWHPFIHVPAGFIKILANPAFTWQFTSEPSEGTAGRSIPATQGKTLGGSSSINGMIYNRCQAADYDNWAQRGNQGWVYADVLPYFKRTERRTGGDDTFRGREGGLAVSDIDAHDPVSDALIASATKLGIPRNPDYNGASQAGVGYMQRTIHRGWRWSSSRAFLWPARSRRNLEIRTRARATRIVLRDRRAVAVQYRTGGDNGPERSLHARREIIVASGALNSPHLLQISGIGPAALLRDLDIEVAHDVPGVGENLRDHFCARLVARIRGAPSFNELARGPRLAGQIVRWLAGRPSILAVSPSIVHLFWKSRDSLDRPDFQAVFAPASYKQGVVGDLDDFPGMTLGFYQQRPHSVGYVRARSRNPLEPPLIQPNYLAEAEDRHVLVEGMKVGRRLFATDPLASYMIAEALPGASVRSDTELLDYARTVGSTVYHFVGTCRMGPATDTRAVVGSDLRVHGIDALRVVDASIMPDIPSGNTNIPVLMIAEKAADLIRGRDPLPRAETLPPEKLTCPP